MSEDYDGIEFELFHAAWNALLKASKDGRPKYPRYAWRGEDEPISGQLDHAETHIIAAMGDDFNELPDTENHLAHAIGRLVIAYARRMEGLP